MARKPNYDFEKRRKEQERKKKKEDKLQRKRENAASQTDEGEPAESNDETITAQE